MSEFNINRFDMVRIKYYDHYHVTTGNIEEIKLLSAYTVEEMGFLLRKDKDFIVIAKTVNLDGEKKRCSFEDVALILRRDVIEMFKLVKVEEEKK